MEELEELKLKCEKEYENNLDSICHIHMQLAALKIKKKTLNTQLKALKMKNKDIMKKYMKITPFGLMNTSYTDSDSDSDSVSDVSDSDDDNEDNEIADHVCSLIPQQQLYEMSINTKIMNFDEWK